MAILTFSGLELGVANTQEFLGSGLSGTGGAVTTPVRTGTYALQINPTTTGTGYVNIGTSIATATGRGPWDETDIYLDVFFRIGTLPSADSEPFLQFATSASALKLELRVNSAGNILAYAADGTTLLATGSTALATDTWYRISAHCGTSATVGDYEVKINGTSEFSGTGNTSATNNGRILMGKVADRNGETVNFYYDDWIISDTGYVGEVKVVVAVPTANGSTMDWAAGTGASDYQEVDEIPLDTATYVARTGAGTALFDVKDSSELGISGTIHAVLAMLYLIDPAGQTTSTASRIRSGSTNSDSSTFNASAGIPAVRLLELDPDTSAAWTTSGIDGIEIGAVEASVEAIRLAQALLMVAYTPASGRTTKNTRSWPLGVNVGMGWRMPA